MAGHRFSARLDDARQKKFAALCAAKNMSMTEMFLHMIDTYGDQAAETTNTLRYIEKHLSVLAQNGDIGDDITSVSRDLAALKESVRHLAQSHLNSAYIRLVMEKTVALTPALKDAVPAEWEEWKRKNGIGG